MEPEKEWEDSERNRIHTLLTSLQEAVETIRTQLETAEKELPDPDLLESQLALALDLLIDAETLCDEKDEPEGVREEEEETEIADIVWQLLGLDSQAKTH